MAEPVRFSAQHSNADSVLVAILSPGHVLCRGEKVNTATKVTYSLGFTAAFLTALLGYVYAKRALHKIQARAQRPVLDHAHDPHSSASALSEPAGTHASVCSERAPGIDAALSGSSRQHVLSHQSEALNYAAESPTSSSDSSPTHRRLMHVRPDE